MGAKSMFRICVCGWYPAGAHAVTWDGLGDDGRRAAAGIYFVRLRTERGIVRGTLVRL